MAIRFWTKELKNSYIGEYKGITETYYIRNLPGDNSNVYQLIAKSGYTVKSVTYEGNFSHSIYSSGFYLRISGTNNTNQRYGFGLSSNSTSEISGRLSGSDTRFHEFGNGFSGSYTYKAIISRDSASITLNGTKYDFTYNSTESNVVNTILNSSTVNAYSSRYDSYVTASDIKVTVEYEQN